MRERLQENPAAVVAVTVMALGLAGWALWANFFRSAEAKLPPNAPAAGGRMPGPMGGMMPNAPMSSSLPGSAGNQGR